MKKLFLVLSGVFGAIPGLAVIRSGLGVPPGLSLLFGGVVEAFGILSLLILWTVRYRISHLKGTEVIRRSVIIASVFLFFLIGYILVFNQCVITDEVRGTAYFPLWTKGDLSKMISDQGSRHAALSYYGLDGVGDAINKESGVYVTFTTIILLLLYQGTFTTLTLAFGLLGLHAKWNRSSVHIVI